MSSRLSPPFATTRWTMVVAAGRNESPEGRRALAELCAAYWYPLYAYLRRRGLQSAEAQDVAQAFFAELLERDRLRLADQQRGRFRSFLLSALNHFLGNYRRQARAEKRGGLAVHVPVDFAAGERRYGEEPADDWTPDRIFERRWAMTVLEIALRRLQGEYIAAGKEHLFEVLKAHLGGSDDRTPYEELARDAGMTSGALRVAAHRLRKRCREVLREEIAETVSTPDEIEDELHALFRAVAN